MSIRVTLAPLFHINDDRRTLDIAFDIGKRFGGHVEALFVQPDPADTIPMVGEGISADTIRQLMDSAVLAIKQRREAVTATFTQACSATDMDVVEHSDVLAGNPSVSWLEITGHNEDIVANRALLSDLVVFAGVQSEMAPALRPTFEAVLLKARRPILVVPEATVDPVGHNVVVAWNGTAEAASALSAAMPFLNSAAAVHLLTAASSQTDTDELDGAADYLAWHGIGCERHVVEPGSAPVGAGLMRKAVAIGADLLVLGGYGHNRLRERILGGVTHHVLNHAELPILIAH